MRVVGVPLEKFWVLCGPLAFGTMSAIYCRRLLLVIVSVARFCILPPEGLSVLLPISF